MPTYEMKIAPETPALDARETEFNDKCRAADEAHDDAKIAEMDRRDAESQKQRSPLAADVRSVEALIRAADQMFREKLSEVGAVEALYSASVHLTLGDDVSGERRRGFDQRHGIRHLFTLLVRVPGCMFHQEYVHLDIRDYGFLAQLDLAIDRLAQLAKLDVEFQAFKKTRGEECPERWDGQS